MASSSARTPSRGTLKLFKRRNIHTSARDNGTSRRRIGNSVQLKTDKAMKLAIVFERMILTEVTDDFDRGNGRGRRSELEVRRARCSSTWLAFPRALSLYYLFLPIDRANDSGRLRNRIVTRPVFSSGQ